MRYSLLYIGMRNNGGPGRIGMLLKRLCVELGWRFSWLHNSLHIPAAFCTEDDVSLENCFKGQFDLVIHNQWRYREFFFRFNGTVPQVLLVMYEDIPPYWQEFCEGLNSILAPCRSIGDHLRRDFPVVHFAVPPRISMNNSQGNSSIRFFYPARDGGEKDRKGIPEFADALALARGNFTVALSLTEVALDRCMRLYPKILCDPRVELLPELTADQYWAQIDSCHALLCPSRTSGIELALLDAIASGVDIVVTDIEPMNDYYSNEEAWFVCSEPLSMESAALGVKRFRASPVHLAKTLDSYCPGERLSCGMRAAERWVKFKDELGMYLRLLVSSGGQGRRVVREGTQ